jgi:hypothetical protein
VPLAVRYCNSRPVTRHCPRYVIHGCCRHRRLILIPRLRRLCRLRWRRFFITRRRCRRRHAKEKAHMTSIAVLPQSRLFLVTTEDGTVKICH